MRLNRSRSGLVCSRVWLAVGLLLAAGALVLGIGSGAGQTRFAAVSDAFHPRFASSFPVHSAGELKPSRAAYAHLPLIFEANVGQSDPQVKFLSRGSGYGLFLTANEAVLALQSPAASGKASDRKNSVIRMQLAGANASPAVVGTDALPGASNYFIGNDPAKWHRNVAQFGRVRYREVYPGVDLVYYGKQGKLEYDFEVAPGADPKLVALKFKGPHELKLDGEGNLVLASGGGDVRFEAPRVYQKIGEKEQTVAGKFVLRGADEVGFELGAYDRSRAVIIDPVLTYSSYLGGAGNEGCSAILGLVVGASGCPAIAVDSAFNIYLAGTTASALFPTQAPFDSSLNGPADVFVSKFNSTGSALIFSTYLGGSGTDYSAGVAVDSAFNVIAAGTTDSGDFPTVNGFQSVPLVGGNHVFVTKFDPAGANLLYSTYLSGTGTEVATGLALDPRNKIYLTGTTTSTDDSTGFPATLGAFQTSSKADSQFFMTKIDPALTGPLSVAYSTYFGGGNPSTGVTQGGGIAVDSVVNANNAFNVYITGGTNFFNTRVDPINDFPTLNGFQTCLGFPNNPDPCTATTATDAFVAKFNPAAPTGAQLLYSTYLGGNGNDVGYGVSVDSTPNTYVTGSTASTDIIIPTGTVPFQSCLNVPQSPVDCTPVGGFPDAFVGKIGNPIAGSTVFPLNYFSYLGGSGTDTALGISVDTTQGARLTGWTNSPNFPNINNPVQSGSGGNDDAFVARIDTTATVSTSLGNFSTYLGGSGNDFGTGITTDVQGNTYVAGETASTNFPKSATPFQGAIGGLTDAFVTKLGPSINITMTASACATPPCNIGIGNSTSYTFTITNNGDVASGVTFTDFLPASGVATFGSITASVAGACGAANGGTVVCNFSTLTSGQTVTVTVNLVPLVPGTLSNSAQVTALAGDSVFTTTASASATVNDFRIEVPAPPTNTVAAGLPATYQITLTPTGIFPNAVTLSCSSGVPTGASCEFTTNPIPNFNTGAAASTVLNINTTARPQNTAGVRDSRPFFAAWLPVSGLAFLGLGIGGTISRKRRLLMGLLLGAFFALILFQGSCSSSGTAPPLTGGTPAGTYTITVTGTSGSVSRTNVLELVVQ